MKLPKLFSVTNFGRIAGKDLRRGVGAQSVGSIFSQTAISMKTLPLLSLCFSMLVSGVLRADQCSISMERYGVLANGQVAHLYTLTNANGMVAEITNYGGIVTRLLVPDRKGKLDDVVLGYNTLDEYVAETPYFGCLVGLYGNRIDDGRFVLDGKTIQVTANSEAGGEAVHLHGGAQGLDKVVWDPTPSVGENSANLELRFLHPDGKEGFPGNVDITVVYRLTNDNELTVSYHATTDKPTVINLTHHSYFNLKGEGRGTALDHELMIRADSITPVDAGLVTTGGYMPVKGTPFDFNKPTRPMDRIEKKHKQLEYGGGFDHNWVLKRKGDGLELAASVYEPSSGRFMEVLTEEPGIQYYAGNFLDGSLVGKRGVAYQKRDGFCLETQHFPDSPNHSSYPSTVLRPGEVYETNTVYRFSVK